MLLINLTVQNSEHVDVPRMSFVRGEGPANPLDKAGKNLFGKRLHVLLIVQIDSLPGRCKLILYENASKLIKVGRDQDRWGK